MRLSLWMQYVWGLWIIQILSALTKSSDLKHLGPSIRIRGKTAKAFVWSSWKLASIASRLDQESLSGDRFTNQLVYTPNWIICFNLTVVFQCSCTDACSYPTIFSSEEGLGGGNLPFLMMCTAISSRDGPNFIQLMADFIILFFMRCSLWYLGMCHHLLVCSICPTLTVKHMVWDLVTSASGPQQIFAPMR